MKLPETTKVRIYTCLTSDGVIHSTISQFINGEFWPCIPDEWGVLTTTDVTIDIPEVEND